MAQISKKRIAYFDNLKALLIILVVFAHCLYDFSGSAVISDIVGIIYTFHMPAFIFISGYLSKSENSRSKNQLVRLFAMYLIFNTIMMAYNVSIGESIKLLEPYNSCWYLLSLIFWRMTCKSVSRLKLALPLTAILAVCVGFFSEITNMLSLIRTIAFYPFFLAGYMLSSDKLLGLVKKRTARDFVKGIFLFCVSAVLSYLVIKKFSPEQNEFLMYAYASPSRAVLRILFFTLAALFTLSLFMCIPNRRVLVITSVGKNTLSIFLLHRIPTLIFSSAAQSSSVELKILLSVAVTVIIVSILGSNAVTNLCERLTDTFVDSFTGVASGKYARIPKICAACVVLAIAASPLSTDISNHFVSNSELTSAQPASPDRIYPQISGELSASLKNSTKLIFAGDLLLLEDQVKRGYKGGKYSFDDVFEFAKSYITDADFAIGVFEGPTAGEAAGYSTSNYDDGKPLFLNFPDEFAYSVKNAGFDLVTTANNHLLDKGISGAQRTLDVLDKVGLDHIGSYRNVDEKNNIKIVTVNGIKIAVLAYTFGSNNITNDAISANYPYLTSLLEAPESKGFESAKASVISDFERTRAEKPDLIIALPHSGEQFSDLPDNYQKTWNDIFVSAGADIVLNDHTHSVQPVEVFMHENKRHIIVNCPGNFANIYREHNGDASAMVEIHINNAEKRPCAASVIPMWTQSQLYGNFRALPIYDILHNTELSSQINSDDLTKINIAQKHITSVMLGKELAVDLSCPRYFITENGVFFPQSAPIDATESILQSPLYKKIISAKSVCYVGDSITEGTKNGGFGWYKPLEQLCEKSLQCAKGGGTTKTILQTVPANSDLYVVAIGTNDVRYRDEKICAMTADEYILQIKAFMDRIRSKKPNADFAFIAPWPAFEDDKASALSDPERDELLNQYSDALMQYCTDNGFVFSNPTNTIRKEVSSSLQSKYLIDYIHPNFLDGIALYSRAVLENAQ